MGFTGEPKLFSWNANLEQICMQFARTLDKQWGCAHLSDGAVSPSVESVSIGGHEEISKQYGSTVTLMLCEHQELLEVVVGMVMS